MSALRVYRVGDPNIPPDAVYVGRSNGRARLRGSRYANPFRMLRDTPGERERVIERYREAALAHLERDPHWLDELRGRSLVCWCAPAACHADVLLELANGAAS